MFIKKALKHKTIVQVILTMCNIVPLRELELCRKTLGERLQRYQALNHMCNQSN